MISTAATARQVPQDSDLAAKVVDAYRDGKSYTEVAAALSLSRNTVAGIVHRARYRGDDVSRRDPAVVKAAPDRTLRDGVIALWQAGKTTGQIAAELGITKNQALGLATRARQAGENVPARPHGAQPQRPEPRIKLAPKKVAKPEPAPVRPPATGKDDAPRLTVVQPADRAPEPVIGAAAAVEALTSSMCRWPMGDPQAETFRFCCAQIAALGGGLLPSMRFYCAEHRAVAIAKPGERRRAA